VFVAADPPRMQIYADRVRMTQVFGNLLNNAAKYSAAGGRIDVRLRRQGDDAVIDISDQGFGIEPEMLPHVFEPFVQGKRDPDQINDGLGIGLSLVRRLVELHGGSVRARSPGSGQGTTVQVRLPLAVPLHGKTVAAPASQGSPAPFSERLRVLVVDDNRDSAETLGLLLTSLEVDNCVALNGADALRAFEDYNPNVIFLDIGMPGMDGYEVARRLRAAPAGNIVCLIALTGWSQAADQIRTREAGFDLHMSKPADIAELQRILGLISAAIDSDASCPESYA
jgi:CheY-like chemotaxis protein